MTANFETAFASFLEGCKTIHADYCKAHKFANDDSWEVKNGPKYVRVIHHGGAFCFVDKTNGDVLKSASWKAPAKHPRGNIYDASNGLKLIGPYGPAYLR